MSHQLTVPKPCVQCGSRDVLETDGKLQCRRCGDSRGQLDEQVSRFIAATEKQFGPIKEPIVVRRKSTAPGPAITTPDRSTEPSTLALNSKK
jgi:hypothetical protein